MHYGEYFFSSNGQKTIDCRGNSCGQRGGLSLWDQGRFYITTGEFILLMVVFKRVPLPLHYALGLSGSINTTSVCAEGDRRGEA